MGEENEVFRLRLTPVDLIQITPRQVGARTRNFWAVSMAGAKLQPWKINTLKTISMLSPACDGVFRPSREQSHSIVN